MDSRLREIAGQYKELLQRMEAVQSEDPQVARLNDEARQAVEADDYVHAEAVLEDVANQHSLAAAGAHADNARLQRIQLRHAKAAAYWQKAAALLPEDKKKERARYLHSAAFDLDRIAKYKEALPLYGQSLRIKRLRLLQEIGDKAGEAETSWNIGLTYEDQGDLAKAEQYISRAVQLAEEISHPSLEEWREELAAVRAQL